MLPVLGQRRRAEYSRDVSEERGKPGQRLSLTLPRSLLTLEQQLLCKTGQASNADELNRTQEVGNEQAQKVHLPYMRSSRLMLEYRVDSTFPTALGPVGGQREEEKRDGARESLCG